MSNTFVSETLYEKLQAKKKKDFENILGYLSFQKP